ncbi:MAG: CHAT domain-containing protein, partial [Candidatus Electrothrix sp. ATG1]|nr:CHAT domain-containing protein [Candidatus Electrothrix sp. ATG1]
LNKEVREIQEKLSRAKDNGQFTVNLAPAVRIHDLQRELLEHEPAIVHFCGHGEEEGILVEDEQGKAVMVPSNALASLFALCAEHVECVFLNSCHSHVQAEAISQHISYVIGMQKDVGDDAAVEFAAGFYNALSFAKSIEQAFEFGRNAVQLYDLPDHLTPILLQRRATVKTPEKIVLLSANPLDEPQSWNPYIEQIKKKIACPIEQHSLNIENLNCLQNDAYLLILSRVIQNKLLIENEYLCKDTISFKLLDDSIGNRQLAGLFLFVHQLPEEKFTAELTLPTFLLPMKNKKHLNTVLYQLFTRKNIDCDSKSRVRNKSAFQLCTLSGKSRLYNNKTPLPDSIDRNKVKGKGFVGRSDDLKHICSALMELDEGEFLTVKGAGGIGKTHTVKKIAVALADRALFPGGIHFIDCEPVTDSKQFQFKAAAVFGLELAEDLWEHLRDHHDQQERLIIFDNFEPLLYLKEEQKIKTILSRVVDYARVLVTSREVLGLEIETVHQMRRLTTDEAAELFTAKFPVPEQQIDFLRQDILSRQLDNNPLAIKLVTGHLPKGKSLNVLREELEKKLFSKVCVDGLEIFDSGPDSNIERMDSIYASILYSYRRLSEQEQTAFELLSLFPDGIHLEEFKRLTRKDKKQKKLPPLLITDHLVKSLSDKSMIENSGGQLKLQSMIGRFAQAMLKQREDIAPLYRNAFAYNRRLASVLHQHLRTAG